MDCTRRSSALKLLCCLLCVLLQCSVVDALWTEFDLVRPKNDSWGSTGTTSWTKISATMGNGPSSVSAGSQFGWSMANIGDLDEDGVDDLAVGAPGESSVYAGGTTEERTGAVYIVYLTTAGTAKSSVRISGEVNGGPKLYKDEAFGFSVSPMGDLDDDGVPDLVVGAPGQLISSVYILFMNRDGTVKGTFLIRGTYTGTKPPELVSEHYLSNGPDLRYLSRFGLSVYGIGDWDQDGIPDIAVTSIAADGGNGLVYFLYMERNGTVKQSYTTIGTDVDGNSVGGAPIFPGRTFAGFGSSLLLISDIDGNGVPELVVGAKDLDDADTTHYRSGVVFVCFMNRDGTVKSYSRISELEEQYNRGEAKEKKKNTFSPGGPLPYVEGDRCGASVTSIGDINLDDMRQQRPSLRSPKADDLENYPNRTPIDDLVVGCPQSETGTMPGRMFFFFLSAAGRMLGYTEIPSEKDKARGIFPPQDPMDHIGQSLAGLQDWDGNGIREFAAGAPGALDTGADSGAIYIFFFRRRRWHSYWTDNRAYWCAIVIPPSLVVFGMISGIIYFCWTFRRKPDEIEILVLKSGVKIEKKRKRKPKVKKEEAKVYVDDADDF